MSGLPRRKKKCGKCQWWRGFPYVHCELGCKMTFIKPTERSFDTLPADPLDCRDRRRAKT